jgi:hypothetical protein
VKWVKNGPDAFFERSLKSGVLNRVSHTAVAIETVRAMGGRGSRNEPNAQNHAQPQQQSDMGVDPALLAAEQIENRLYQFKELLNDDQATTLRDGASDVLECSQRLQSLKTSLGGFSSKHTLEARSILEDAISVAKSISKSAEMNTSGSDNSAAWSDKLDRWRQVIDTCLGTATG